MALEAEALEVAAEAAQVPAALALASAGAALCDGMLRRQNSHRYPAAPQPVSLQTSGHLRANSQGQAGLFAS